VRIEASVQAETKARLEALRNAHDLPNLGAVLDAVMGADNEFTRRVVSF
jgi:hypothetical protein